MKTRIARLFFGLFLLTTAYGQDIKALNGYKYLSLPTIKWSDGRIDPYGIARRVGDYFAKKGFVVIAGQSTRPNELQIDPCLLLNCSIEGRMGFDASVTITLQNCKNERVFSNKGRGISVVSDVDAYYVAIRKALAPLNSLGNCR